MAAPRDLSVTGREPACNAWPNGMIGRRDPGLEAERTFPRSRETTRRTAAAIGCRVPDGSPALSILLANSSQATGYTGFARPARLILPSFRRNDPLREFTSSITLGDDDLN